jgi:hypothetical protein
MQHALKEYIKDSLFSHVQVLENKGQPSFWVPSTEIYDFERVKLHLNDRHFLMTDYDHSLSNAHLLYDVEPNFVIYNPVSSTHQAFWLLATPVHCQNKQSAAYRYLRAVETGYDLKYQCDPNFQRHIHRNPLFHGSDIEFLNSNRHTLKELAEIVELNNVIPQVERQLHDDAEGRNCALFDELRVWAYRQIKTLSERDFDAFTAQLITRASRLNTFSTPLPDSEIKSIARSIARFCIARLDNHAKFSAKQARRGAIGGKVSKGGGRPKKLNSELWESINTMKKEGYSNRAIAEDLSISASTVSKYINRAK